MKKYLAILLAMFMLAGCAQAPITDTTEINSQDSEKTQANQGKMKTKYKMRIKHKVKHSHISLNMVTLNYQLTLSV